MADTLEMCFAGSGGQGVILCSILMAKAALLHGVHVAQSQSYGPEARGGSCKAEVVISEAPIDYPEVEQIDFLLALTQDSLDKYIKDIYPGAIVMFDSTLKLPDDPKVGCAISLPILSTAKEEIGNPMTANIVALGAINACLHICSKEALQQTVADNVPAGTEELNLKALEAGASLLPPELVRPFWD